MTLRAALLGVLGAALVCGLSYFNDRSLKQLPLAIGFMPYAIYGALIAFVLFVNPLLARLNKRFALSGKELALVLALALVGASIPHGIVRNWILAVIAPHHYARSAIGWQEEKIIEEVPEQMLVDVSGEESQALNGFVQGMAVGTRHVPVSQVPWGAWRRVLLFWIPLIVVMLAAVLSLGVVVHKQWAEHEHLPYPIAHFGNSLLPNEGEERASLFSNRLFWIGAAAVFTIHFSNYLYEWFPGWIQIPLSFSFNGFKALVPTFVRGGGVSLLTLRVFFVVVAFAFLVATDVSFSVGIGPYLYYYAVGLLMGYGVIMSDASQYYGGGVNKLFGFGAYLGLFLVFAYTGRHYYRDLLSQSLFLKREGEADGTAVLAGRVFVVSSLLFVGMLSFAGLDWQMATCFAAVSLLVFLVLSRVLAETGLIVVAASFYPSVVLVSLFGAKALGIKTILIMHLLSAAFMSGSMSSTMPTFVNSLRLMDLRKLALRKPAIWCFAALLVGLAVAVPVSLYFQYDSGMDQDDFHGMYVSKGPFSDAMQNKERLIAQGNLEESQSISGWQRFFHISPKRSSVYALVAGLGLTLLFTFLRLRFRRFPFHPVMFLVWSTYMGKMVAGSFLLGCLIKVVVVKYGGHSLYQRSKPLMFGLIAGEVAGGLAPIAVGMVYYFITGDLPKPFNIIPGSG